MPLYRTDLNLPEYGEELERASSAYLPEGTRLVEEPAAQSLVGATFRSSPYTTLADAVAKSSLSAKPTFVVVFDDAHAQR